MAVASAQSPAGMLMAGKYGIPPLSVGVRAGVRGPVSLPEQWRICQEAAAEHGRVVRRQDWRLVMPTHLADSREEAIADARAGVSEQYWEYFHLTNGHPVPAVDSPSQLIDAMMAAGSIVVGTPDDCIAAIERLQEISGGFGTFLVQAHDWTNLEKMRRSYELLARYVMPRFQGTLVGIQGSNRWARANREALYGQRVASLERAHQSYEEQAGVRQ
jgi:limonene 1,2-monooxygenase